MVGDLGDELVDAGDGVEHGAAKHGVSEAVARELGRVRVAPHALEGVEVEGKSPFAVGAALDTQEPPVAEIVDEAPLDVLPAADVAVVHPHQPLVPERMAVAVRQRTLGRGPHVRKDQRRRRLRRQSLEVDAVPRRDRRREYARLRTQLRVRVVPDSESIAVVRPALVLYMN